MKGYLKNEKAHPRSLRRRLVSQPAISACSMRTAIVIIKDRSKDIIISGGENISSIEVEDVLHKHPRRAVRRRSCKNPMPSGAKCPAPSSN